MFLRVLVLAHPDCPGRLTFVVINYYMYTLQYTIHDTNKLSKTVVKMNRQSEMRPVTSVFRDQQCMLGVKNSLLIVHKVFIFIQQSVVDEE